MTAVSQASLDQQAARVRDYLDENFDALTTILHSDGQLADVVRVAIGAVIVDVRLAMLEHPDELLAVLAAWAQIAEPETVR